MYFVNIANFRVRKNLLTYLLPYRLTYLLTYFVTYILTYLLTYLMHITRLKDIQNIFWTPFLRSTYVLCTGGRDKLPSKLFDLCISMLYCKHNRKHQPLVVCCVPNAIRAFILRYSYEFRVFRA